ncbi:MAG: universal stress protein [Desulfobacterales bacterium]|nr:universal stress protein [Desulfobacterales bacterium]
MNEIKSRDRIFKSGLAELSFHLNKKEEKDMYKKIMVPLDGSDVAECVLPHVKAFIKGFNISEVLLVRVVEPVKPDLRVYDNIFNEDFIRQAHKIWKDIEQQEKTSARNYLEQVSEQLKRKGTTIRSKVLVGNDEAKNLADCAESSGADLIIMATHGYSGIARWVTGSVAEKLFRSAGVTVLMVRAAEAGGGV